MFSVALCVALSVARNRCYFSWREKKKKNGAPSARAMTSSRAKEDNLLLKCALAPVGSCVNCMFFLFFFVWYLAWSLKVWPERRQMLIA